LNRSSRSQAAGLRHNHQQCGCDGERGAGVYGNTTIMATNRIWPLPASNAFSEINRFDCGRSVAQTFPEPLGRLASDPVPQQSPGFDTQKIFDRSY
jgi:hypothetical protein